MTIHRRRIAVLAVAALVAGCAPDEFRPSPGFDGFLDLIGQECYPNTVGGVLIKSLVAAPTSAGFLDATSNLYYGKMTPFAYRQFVTAFTDNGTATNKGIDCIVGKLPTARPGTPGGTGIPAGRDGVPPPPSR